ncbi:acetylxylan esterase [Streptomyces sp. NPDC006530]
MPLTDLGPDELHPYRPELSAPGDFDEFWRGTLADWLLGLGLAPER